MLFDSRKKTKTEEEETQGSIGQPNVGQATHTVSVPQYVLPALPSTSTNVRPPKRRVPEETTTRWVTDFEHAEEEEDALPEDTGYTYE